MYPVNDVGFNIRSNDFVFTCGSDGTINYWDYEVITLFSIK
jgi:hypothetical protein